MSKKVRPRGFMALLLFAGGIDFMQALVGLVTFPIPIPFLGTILNIFLSICMQCFLFIWGGHNDLPSQFEHRFATRILVIIGEWIPIINWFPMWTLYALTYWVEREEEDTSYGFSSAQMPPTRRQFLNE